MKLLKNYITDYFQEALAAADSRGQKFFIVLNLLLPFFIGLYVFLNPFRVSSLKEALFYLSVLGALLVIIAGKTEFSFKWPLTIPFLFFFLWAVIGLFFTLDLHNTINDIRVYLINYLILFFLLVNTFNSRKKLESISWLLIISTAAFSVGAIVYFYFIQGNPFNARLGSNFRLMYTGTMCVVIVAAIPLMVNQLFRSRSTMLRLLLGASLIVTTLATLLNQSRSGIIGLVAALSLLLINKKKAVVFVIVALLLVVAIPGVRNRIIEEGLKDIRININRLFFEVVKDYPVTGVGFGISIYNNPELIDLTKYNEKIPEAYQMKPWWLINTPHNTYMSIAVRTGIVGLLFFLMAPGIAVFLLWRVWKKSQSEYFRSWAVCLLASLAAVMTQILFVDMYHPTAITYYTLLAMITILWSAARKDQLSQNTGND